jgi:predicted enzyme related to lactoylglutathione lyase
LSTKQSLTLIGQPVPELPVTDVERAQQHYRDALGFEIGWVYPGKEIGAVSRGNAAIFFRKRTPPFEPVVHWVFAEDIDATYDELKSSGANVVEPKKKALGAKAVHRRGSRRKPFLFPP